MDLPVSPSNRLLLERWNRAKIAWWKRLFYGKRELFMTVARADIFLGPLMKFTFWHSLAIHQRCPVLRPMIAWFNPGAVAWIAGCNSQEQVCCPPFLFLPMSRIFTCFQFIISAIGTGESFPIHFNCPIKALIIVPAHYISLHLVRLRCLPHLDRVHLFTSFNRFRAPDGSQIRHAALSLGKFYACWIERHHVYTLVWKCRHLRYG